MKTINKKVASLFLSVLMMMTVFAFGINSSYAASRISIYIDGNYLNMDEPPVIRDGRTLVPLKAIMNSIGCTVEWYSEDQSIMVYSSDGEKPLLAMNINNSKAIIFYDSEYSGDIAEAEVTIEAPPVIVGGRTMVPLRFIAETIGYEVEWDEQSKTVYLIKPDHYDSEYDDFMSDKSKTNYDIFPEGIVFSEDLVYEEEYYLYGDPGEALSSEYAALALTWARLNDNYDVYHNDGGFLYITLVDIRFVEDEECYVFEVKKGTNASSFYAVGYFGNIYDLR